MMLDQEASCVAVGPSSHIGFLPSSRAQLLFRSNMRFLKTSLKLFIKSIKSCRTVKWKFDREALFAAASTGCLNLFPMDSISLLIPGGLQVGLGKLQISVASPGTICTSFGEGVLSALPPLHQLQIANLSACSH